jgi:hypothetical protein
MGRAYSTKKEKRRHAGGKDQRKEHSYHRRMQNQYVELHRTRVLTVRRTLCTVSSYFTPPLQISSAGFSCFPKSVRIQCLWASTRCRHCCCYISSSLDCHNVDADYKENVMKCLDIQSEFHAVLLAGYLQYVSICARNLDSYKWALFFLFVIPFYLQSVLVHSANCVKTHIQWHVEEYSVAFLCN